MPKAVFLDIDGTLLSFATRLVPKSALDAMSKAKERGVRIFIATGRHKSELGTDPNLYSFPFDGYVTQNGAYCHTKEKVIHKTPLRKCTLEALVANIEREPFTCIFCEEERMFMNKSDEMVIGLLDKFKLPVPPVGDLQRALSSEIYQVVPIVSKQNEHLIENLPGAKVTKWYDGGYDIVNEDVNKWLGIEKMLAHYSISPSDTAAIGDAENDMEMLLGAGYSVAMGNAPEAVKKCAKHVTSHIDEDGIKNAFEYLFER